MMKDVIGFVLCGHDNDTYMFDGDQEPERCPLCGTRADPQAHNPRYRLRLRRLDISATYDGQTIVSAEFRAFCLEQGYTGVEFLAFEEDPAHFHLIVHEVVPFDAQRRETRFEKLCPLCGEYECVVGATPAFLLRHEPLGDGFYRTDLCFACRHEKHPMFLVGIETERKLKQAKLKGLVLTPAYGLE